MAKNGKVNMRFPDYVKIKVFERNPLNYLYIYLHFPYFSWGLDKRSDYDSCSLNRWGLSADSEISFIYEKKVIWSLNIIVGGFGINISRQKGY